MGSTLPQAWHSRKGQHQVPDYETLQAGSGLQTVCLTPWCRLSTKVLLVLTFQDPIKPELQTQLTRFSEHDLRPLTKLQSVSTPFFCEPGTRTTWPLLTEETGRKGKKCKMNVIMELKMDVICHQLPITQIILPTFPINSLSSQAILKFP